MDPDWLGIVLTQVLNGLTTISALALIALGLAIIFGMMGIINLAHGEFFMIGAYVVWLVLAVGGNFWLGLIAAPLAVAAIGAVMERGILRHLRERFLDTILATWGISVFLREAIRALFGNDTKTIAAPFEGSVQLGSIVYPVYYLFVIVATAVILVATLLFFRGTLTGIRVRAVLQRPDAAAVLGIGVSRMRVISFAVGAGLAGFAGAVMAPLIGVYPIMGLRYMVQSFLAVILGGLGGVGGVLAGSAVIGGLQSALTFTIDPVVGTTLTLVLVIVILCFRPRGLFRP